MTTLMDDAYFKYIPEKHQILCLTFSNDLKTYCVIRSQEYIKDLNQLVTKEISLSQFKLRLSEMASQEFEQVLRELMKFGIFKSDDKSITPNSKDMNIGVRFSGEFFTVQVEELFQENVMA